MKFQQLKYPETQLLKLFLTGAGTSLNTFRYFNTRSLDVIKNHIYTIVLLSELNVPIGYGHLDVENDIVWLGMAISESHTGKGLGKLVLNNLIEHASDQKIESIKLSVDNDNIGARSLYEKFNFKLLERKEKISFYELTLN